MFRPFTDALSVKDRTHLGILFTMLFHVTFDCSFIRRFMKSPCRVSFFTLLFQSINVSSLTELVIAFFGLVKRIFFCVSPSVVGLTILLYVMFPLNILSALHTVDDFLVRVASLSNLESNAYDVAWASL